MEKVNYDKEMEKVIEKNVGKPTLLLHSCCAPCSSACLERLFPHFEITVFFFNPNITIEEEYYKRLAEQKRFLKEVYGERVNLIEGRYSPEEFFFLSRGLEEVPEKGERCYKCYEARIKETAVIAKECGYDFFCTTLSLSPHKNAEWINVLGKKYEEEFGVKFLPSDFKKRGGYRRSVELSAEYGLYRQDYCGCIYSKNERLKYESNCGKA